MLAESLTYNNRFARVESSLRARSQFQGRALAANTDAELVKRVQSGDDRAFDLLYVRHKDKINTLIAGIISHPSDVEDVLQESFIKAYKALPRFRGESQFYTWLYRIAVNTAKNHIASVGRRPQASDIDIAEEVTVTDTPNLHETDTPERELMRYELEQTIKKSIQELEPELKSALTLREYAGLSYEQIAEIMECPVGTVRSRIHRAREAVKSKMPR